MNTNALAVMSLGLNQQVGLRCEPLGFGERAFLYLGYPLFGSISKELFGYISGLNIGEIGIVKMRNKLSPIKPILKIGEGV
jgi:hypothetical protein